MDLIEPSVLRQTTPLAVETASEEVDDVELECFALLRELGIPIPATVPSTTSSVEEASERQVIKGKEGEGRSLEESVGAFTSTERERAEGFQASPSRAASSSSALPEESVASTSLPSPLKQVDDVPRKGRESSSLSLSRADSRRDSPPAHSSRARSRSPRGERGGESSKSRLDDSTRTVVCENLSIIISRAQLERHFQGLRFMDIRFWKKKGGENISADVLLCSPSEAQLAIRRLDGRNIGRYLQPTTVRLADASSTSPPAPRYAPLPRRHDRLRSRSPETRPRGTAEVGHRRLFIPALDPSVSELKLRELFSPFGVLESILVGVKSGTRDQHQAFINYEDHRDAHAARHATNGSVIGSWKSAVKLSFPLTRR